MGENVSPIFRSVRVRETVSCVETGKGDAAESWRAGQVRPRSIRGRTEPRKLGFVPYGLRSSHAEQAFSLKVR